MMSHTSLGDSHQAERLSFVDHSVYSGPAIIRTPIVRKTRSPDGNARERISVTLFVLTSQEIRIPILEAHFGNGTYYSLVNFPQ
ncbi:hypothetical protein CI610_02953 [invertebrate metagenome]|uniref:Uncharacterized protein n=1 Tax=invertebrate metagenome TaxID=1711999 RepID=A0A2H9T4H7_9ZZZZ